MMAWTTVQPGYNVTIEFDCIWIPSVGFVKDSVYVPPLLTRAGDLETRITVFCAKTDHGILQIVLKELKYSFDIFRPTLGVHSDCRQTFVFKPLLSWPLHFLSTSETWSNLAVHKCRATKFFTVAPNIFGIITAVFFLYIKRWVSVHMQQTESASSSGSRWTLSMELTSCHPYGT
jgi:hypothetical protein